MEYLEKFLQEKGTHLKGFEVELKGRCEVRITLPGILLGGPELPPLLINKNVSNIGRNIP